MNLLELRRSNPYRFHDATGGFTVEIKTHRLSIVEGCNTPTAQATYGFRINPLPDDGWLIQLVNVYIAPRDCETGQELGRISVFFLEARKFNLFSSLTDTLTLNAALPSDQPPFHTSVTGQSKGGAIARLGSIFLASLAVAGESGTLKKRYQSADLHGAAVQAKTGYINGVSCLSGYITMPDGRTRSFSVLVNDLPPGTVSQAKALQDHIVQAVAADMASAAGVTLGGD